MLALLAGFVGYGYNKGLIRLGATSVFSSFQIGTSAQNGDILQTNGTDSVWVATSTLGFPSTYPFPFSTYGTLGVSTSTTLYLLNGAVITGSSTIQTANLGSVTIPSLTLGSLAVNSSGVVYKAATTTYSTGLTYTNGAVTCDTASGSVFGCLASADWTTFNNKAPNSIFTYYASTFATTTPALSLPNSGMIGFMGNAAVTTSNYSLLGNTTLTLLNARSGGSIGFRINNTDVANFNTSGGYGFGSTYYNIDAGQNNMIVEGKLGVGVSAPTYNLDVAGLGHFTGLVDALRFTATSSTLASSFPQFTFTNATGTSIVALASSTAQYFNSASSSITYLNTVNSSSTLFSSGIGSVTGPSISVGSGNAGIYQNTANILGFAAGGAGASWNGSAFYPNTTNARTLGLSANIWNGIWVNQATTTNITALGSSTLQILNSASSTLGTTLFTGNATGTNAHFSTSIFSALGNFTRSMIGHATATSLYIGSRPVYPRWDDRMSIPSATTTDEMYKFGSCLEVGGHSVTLDRLDVHIASTSNITNAANDGMTFNFYIAAVTSSTSPMKLFTSSTTVTGTSSVKSFTSGFQTATIPAGYCYWFVPHTASTSQINQLYVNLYGYEN